MKIWCQTEIKGFKMLKHHDTSGEVQREVQNMDLLRVVRQTPCVSRIGIGKEQKRRMVAAIS